MNFSDFKDNPQDLVGKDVLHESGMPYTKQQRTLTKITKVDKKGFNIFSQEDRYFSLIDGSLKGSKSSFHSQCTLISLEERNQLKKEWYEAIYINKIRAKIIENVGSLSFEKLKQIEGIIDSNS